MISERVWGRHQDRAITLYTISNSRGHSVSVSEFGAAVVALSVGDRNGNIDDVVCGYDALDTYVADRYYMGVILGRCANRIRNPVFRLGEDTIRLSQNQGPFHLHGGSGGFHKRCWSGQAVGENTVAMQRVSPDGEEGYPGNLCVTVLYSWDDSDELTIRYTAVSDRDTIVSLSNHSYFCLSGHADANAIHGDRVMINADYFVQIDGQCASTGAILPVDGTPLDLRLATALGEGLANPHEQIALGSGYNHTFVLRGAGHAASLWNEASGRRMDVLTDQPGLHLYTGNYLGEVGGKQGAIYRRYGALCFETQHYPEAVNMPHFPSPVLKAGHAYGSATVFRFSTF